MKIYNGILKSRLILLLLIIGLLASCVSQRQVKYLQKTLKQDTATTFANKRLSDYKIQSNDNLYIKVISLDDKSYSFFNKQAGSNSASFESYNDAAIYLNSYNVDDSGYIMFPVIGKMYVKDLTLDQAKTLIQSMVNEYVKETIIIMKMVNFNITVVGEVRRPGQIKVYQEKINIFELISLAGDLTDFANRSKVALIRQTRGGSRVIYLDLNSDKILNSEYYYMRPNDILYVSPLGVKRWGFETFPWVVVFSAISTTILMVNYLKNF